MVNLPAGKRPFETSVSPWSTQHFSRDRRHRSISCGRAAPDGKARSASSFELLLFSADLNELLLNLIVLDMFPHAADEVFASCRSRRVEVARHVCFATNERVLGQPRARQERERERERLCQWTKFLIPKESPQPPQISISQVQIHNNICQDS